LRGKRSTLRRLEELGRGIYAKILTQRLPVRHRKELLRSARDSKAQLFQDLFVLSEVGFKTGGYFVEFGATDGVDLSNTYMLEKNFGWNGILAEPGRMWHSALRNNRTCHIDTSCVWTESNSVLKFNASEFGEYSTIDSFSSSDRHAALRGSGEKYSVETVSLVDLLGKYGAPRVIDYLSIDTEGSEYDILSSFDFSKYEIRVITCEHNFTPQRRKIFSLLTEKGYVRKLGGLSLFDDWYVRAQ